MAGPARRASISPCPSSHLRAGPDPAGSSTGSPRSRATDLTFSALFSVVSGGAPALPAKTRGDEGRVDRRSPRRARTPRSTASSTVQETASEVEMRLYDLTSPEFRQIAAKKFELPAAEARRLAHKVADEIVFQFTGELGDRRHEDRVRECARGAQGDPPGRLRRGGADAAHGESVDQSLAGVESRTCGRSPSRRTCAAIRISTACSRSSAARPAPVRLSRDQYLAGLEPGRQLLALTLSKDGNPKIYILTVATGAFRRLTTFTGIDTEPTWSPTGREIAFVSDRRARRRST